MSWWRHQMETFSVFLAFCVGNSPVTCEFPAQRPVTQSFDVFFDLRLNKQLGRQSWGWWFEMASGSLWLQCNGIYSILGSIVVTELYAILLSNQTMSWQYLYIYTRTYICIYVQMKGHSLLKVYCLYANLRFLQRWWSIERDGFLVLAEG